ncbi:glycosyltransferase involved in cell wall biosynthesis [Streptococcus rupicaprae]|uniref:Glycosyltransferase involved in cell wall biosynthesis n=1 Tax=Streptococcus rupicaprae TaxID=759619 RepID=A0ABV2FGH2_9STRE
MKKKLVFTIGSLSGGGAERVISILANHLCQDYDVTILALLKDEVAYDLDSRVRYQVIDLPEQLKGIMRNLQRLRQIRRTIKAINPHVVISFLTTINIMVLAALAFTSYPIIVSERNDPNAETPTKLGRLIRDVSYYSRKRIFFVFQTQYAKDCFKGMTEKNSAIIFNPLKKEILPAYQGTREKRIVCVARLEPAKNLPLLIRAFHRFKKSHPDYQLEFFGKGPLEAELKALIRTLDMEDNVVFHGFTRDVHSKIHRAKMFILPSDYEGISNAMLEALAMGIPTICTDCPAYGGRLFIEDGKSGFLIPVGHEEALLEKMLTLAENDDLGNAFSQNSQVIKERLSEDLIVEQWRQLIGEL